jgi:hypothetical protein
VLLRLVKSRCPTDPEVCVSPWAGFPLSGIYDNYSIVSWVRGVDGMENCSDESLAKIALAVQQNWSIYSNIVMYNSSHGHDKASTDYTTSVTGSTLSETVSATA